MASVLTRVLAFTSGLISGIGSTNNSNKMIWVQEYFDARGTPQQFIVDFANKPIPDGFKANSDPGLEWTLQHRLQGVSYVLVNLWQPPYDKREDAFYEGVPEIHFVMRGIKIDYPGISADEDADPGVFNPTFDRGRVTFTADSSDTDYQGKIQDITFTMIKDAPLPGADDYGNWWLYRDKNKDGIIPVDANAYASASVLPTPIFGAGLYGVRFTRYGYQNRLAIRLGLPSVDSGSTIWSSFSKPLFVELVNTNEVWKFSNPSMILNGTTLEFRTISTLFDRLLCCLKSGDKLRFVVADVHRTEATRLLPTTPRSTRCLPRWLPLCKNNSCW